MSHGCKIGQIGHVALRVDLADPHTMVDIVLIHDTAEELFPIDLLESLDALDSLLAIEKN